MTNSSCLFGHGPPDLSCQPVSHQLKGKDFATFESVTTHNVHRSGYANIAHDDPQNPTVRKEETQT